MAQRVFWSVGAVGAFGSEKIEIRSIGGGLNSGRIDLRENSLKRSLCSTK